MSKLPYLSEAVRTFSLFLLVAEVPLPLRVRVLIRRCLDGRGLRGDVSPGRVEVSQSDEINQRLHPVGIEKDLDVLFVMEQLVDEHEETVSLCPVLTLRECDVRCTH